MGFSVVEVETFFSGLVSLIDWDLLVLTFDMEMPDFHFWAVDESVNRRHR